MANNQEQDRFGVSGVSYYLPKFKVELEEWANWYNHPYQKLVNVVGKSFRMCSSSENIYSMSANACLELIKNCNLNRDKIGMIILASESSTDNATGAIIIKGIIDDYYADKKQTGLNSNCEIFEMKQACLSGLYGLVNAVRYLQSVPQDQSAIVVATDIALYNRGSSGEYTQGAGSVAMLVERNPKLLALDVAKTGKYAAYRYCDFRKPTQRFNLSQSTFRKKSHNDSPVYNGKYSTYCYLNSVKGSFEDFAKNNGLAIADIFNRTKHFLFHRPYKKMPQQALAGLFLYNLLTTSKNNTLRDDKSIQSLVDEIKGKEESLLAEWDSMEDISWRPQEERVRGDFFVKTSETIRNFRKHSLFKSEIDEKLQLGQSYCAELGNLYSASLPAWIGAFFVDADKNKLNLEKENILLVGYGSGDASMCVAAEVVPNWQKFAKNINLQQALSSSYQLDQRQYEALHDNGELSALEEQYKNQFIIDNIGENENDDFQDLGVAYFKWAMDCDR